MSTVVLHHNSNHKCEWQLDGERVAYASQVKMISSSHIEMFAYAFVSLSGQIKDKSMDRLSHQTDKETKRHTDRQRDKRECEHLNLGEAIPMHGANLKLTK